MLRFETKEDEVNIKNSNVARRVRWKQLMTENKGKIDLHIGELMLADHIDTYLHVQGPTGRSLCGHRELDESGDTNNDPFTPHGSYDGKVVDAAKASRLSFVGRWGAACGLAFDAKRYLAAHPQYEWMEDLLYDRPTQPWTEFKNGE